MHSSLIIIPENRCNDGGLLILRYIHKTNPQNLAIVSAWVQILPLPQANYPPRH